MLETSLGSLRISATEFVQSSFQDEIEKGYFTEAEAWLINWATNRQIFSENADGGFLTKDIISVMLLVVLVRLRALPMPLSKFVLIKTFVALYSTWDFNECSVSSQCCRSHGLCGSLICENEGLDSDCEDGDMHPSKRFRSDLGQIRDLRRFYEVDMKKFVSKISLAPSEYVDKLDYIDAMTVVHPTSADVNLSIRVLESHKKLIVQELTRAEMFLTDSLGDDQDLLFQTVANYIHPRRGSSLFVVFELQAENAEILETITQTFVLENLFLVQETQAFQGVMVLPFPAAIPLNGDSLSVVTGFAFPAIYPYCATPGLGLDFNGPMSRALLRAKQTIRERADYEEILAGKFSVRAAIRRTI